MKDAELAPEQIDWVVPHQANLRIIDQVAARIQVPYERVIINITDRGNTSSASIPIALDEAIRDGRIKPGHGRFDVCTRRWDFVGFRHSPSLVRLSDAPYGATSPEGAIITVKLAWLFPGQGAQTVGMGKALYDSSKRAKAIFDRADEALGWKLSTLCFDGPDTDLMLTANTQPAILTTSIAILEAIREQLGSALPIPSLVAGHSLGEYTALVAAEALSLEDAVRLVNLRGRAMQEAVPAGLGCHGGHHRREYRASSGYL